MKNDLDHTLEEVVYLVDYDGSAGVTRINNEPKTLYEANPKLNARIAADLLKPNVTQVSLQLTSLRNAQNNNLLGMNQNHNGCAYTEMTRYANKLEHLPNGKKIKLRRMLLQDYQQGKAPGTTWNAVLTNTYLRGLTDPVSVGDNKKVIITFTHMWHAYFDHKSDGKSPRPRLRFKACDDDMKTLETISRVFQFCPGLMPPGAKIEFIHYDHDVDRKTSVEHAYIDRELSSYTATNNSTTPVQPFDMANAIKHLEKLLAVDFNNGAIKALMIPKGITLAQLNVPIPKLENDDCDDDNEVLIEDENNTDRPLSHSDDESGEDDDSYDSDDEEDMDYQRSVKKIEKSVSSCCDPILNYFSNMIFGNRAAKQTTDQKMKVR